MAGSALLAFAGSAAAAAKRPPAPPEPAIAADLAALEKRAGGKLGMAVLDCGGGVLAGYRLDERFTMCSTFKLSLAALVLQLTDQNKIPRDMMLPIAETDLIGNAPTVRALYEKGQRQANVLRLARAAQMESDNGAANILLRKIGGPEALTAFWRSLGDETSRLDRYEPDLNTSHGDDPRDTTTPAAMAKTMNAMLTGKTLRPGALYTLIGWMNGTQTGLKRLRGGLSEDWRAGDKTGTMSGADYPDKTNDIAMISRPGRKTPFMLTSFYEGKAEPKAELQPEAVLAEAARIAARWMEWRPL